MSEPSEPDPEGTDGTATVRAGKLIGGGRALVHHGGRTWMVSGALPGEVVVARPYARRAGIVEAVTERVVGQPHPARLAHPCPHAPHCGGCDWPHVDTDHGALLKRAAAAEAARGEPLLAGLIAEAPVRRSPLGYRLRARLHWDPSTRRLGFHRSRSHSVSHITHCRIVSPMLLSVTPAIARSLGSRCPHRVEVEWLEGSDPEAGVAALRSPAHAPVTIRETWLPRRSELPDVIRGFHALRDDGSPAHGWGDDEVVMELPIPLAVPIGAFFQSNRHLVHALFDRVADLAGTDSQPAYDLHAGVGFLAAAVGSRCERSLTLVEPHVGAAKAAARNLPDATVLIGSTAEEFLGSEPDLPATALAITDPPRSGLTAAVRRGLIEWRPDRILMLGCDPATWSRDAGALLAHGYRVTDLELFDLFPSTHHVEILALLESG